MSSGAVQHAGSDIKGTFALEGPATLHRRTMPRFSIDAPVALERNGVEKPVIGRSVNLSWGGACVLIPDIHLAADDEVLLKFPWVHAKAFAARAKVAWRNRIDDARTLIGFAFSGLTIGDQNKLERVLCTIAPPNAQPEADATCANSLEISFLDKEQNQAFFEQIRLGRFQTCVFRPFQPDEPIRLVINGLDDLPTLTLRARIAWQKPFTYARDSQPLGIFETELALEHPLEDLKRTADKAFKLLDTHRSGISFAAE